MSFHPALRLIPLQRRAVAGVRAQARGLRQVDLLLEPVYGAVRHATHDPGGGSVS